LLSRLLGDRYPCVWMGLCSAVGIDAESPVVNDDEFDRLLDEMAQQDALCHVLAMSWRIRRTAAAKLAALGR
jgi:hypothetical protein